MSYKNYDRIDRNNFCKNITGNQNLLNKKINKVNNTQHHQESQLKATSEHSGKTNRKTSFVEKHLNKPETDWNSNDTLKIEEVEVSLNAFNMT